MRESVDELRTSWTADERVSRFVEGRMFAEYIDRRVDHPSNDIMTELLNGKFEDETGTVRGLTREELLTYPHGSLQGPVMNPRTARSA